MPNRWPLLIAAVIGLLNAVKPVCVDDAYYLRLAREIVQHPAEPYGPPPHGFDTIWGNEAQGAFTILAPPVVPYYLALGVSLFGDEPSRLKLFLFPLIWLFTASVFSLARRFVPERPREVLVLVGLSAASLPCWNLMLDLPALAFGLAALALFSNGLESRRHGWFVASGGMLALAFETKYNAVGFFALVALWGWHDREFRRTVLCLSLAVVSITVWEGYVAVVYGESHCLHHTFRRFASTETGIDSAPLSEKRSHLILPLIGTFGAVAPYLWVLVAASVPRWLSCFGVLLLAFVFLLPADWQVFERWKNGTPRSTYGGFLFVLIGTMNLIALVVVATRRPRKILLLWVAIEFAVAFWMSPFCAARRVVGVVVASTFLLVSVRREPSRMLVVFAALWGLTLYTVDAFDVRVEPDAVRQLAGDYPAEKVWFCGHWGFADAGERVGWRVVYPGRSDLQRGDLLVVPDSKDRPASQAISIPTASVEVLETRSFSSLLPIRTVPDWYGGKLPFRRHDGASLTVTIFRVREPFRVRPPGEAVPTSPTRGEP